MTTSCSTACRGHARADLRARGGAAARHPVADVWRGAPASTRGSSTQIAAITTAPRRAIADAGAAPRSTGGPGGGPSGSGFSDAQVAYLPAAGEAEVRAARLALGVRGDVQDRRHLRGGVRGGRRRTTTRPTRTRTRSARPTRPRVVILGSGPNRIGQGIEFDYCCVHASMALRDAGLRDRDDQLQPRDGLDRLRHLRPALLRARSPRRTWPPCSTPSGGAGPAGRRGDRRASAGQTPLKLAGSLPTELVLGTSPASIDLAEDRERWNALCARSASPARRWDGDHPAEALASRRGSATRCSCGRATCSAGARWRSSTTTTAVRRVMAHADDGALAREGGRRRRSGRCWSTASWRTRSRSTSTPCATAPARC